MESVHSESIQYTVVEGFDKSQQNSPLQELIHAIFQIWISIKSAISALASAFQTEESSYSLNLRKNTTDWIFHQANPRPDNELQLLDALNEHLPNFTLDRLLGSGSFSKAFLISTDTEGQTKHMVLKFTRFQKAKEKPEYFSLSKETFGGEWTAFLEHGKNSAKTTHAIAYDNKAKQFILVNSLTIQDMFKSPEKREAIDLTFVGSLSEYIDGAKDLKSKISENPSYFTTDKMRSIGKQILLGVSDIHQIKTTEGKALIHRDLKPANILIDPLDQIRIIDFGCACIEGQEASDNYRGSGLYAAPELKEGKPYNRKVDSYAVGMTLFQMATGKHLKNAGSTLDEIQDEDLRDLIFHLTATHPEERLSPEEALKHKFFLS